MADQWFYVKGGQRFGPFALDQLQQLTMSGLLSPADMISNGGEGGWVSAGTVAGLFPPSATSGRDATSGLGAGETNYGSLVPSRGDTAHPSSVPTGATFAARPSEPVSLRSGRTYLSYEEVPWYRKTTVVSPLTLLGFICGPAILVVCLVVLTGDVYYHERDATGGLKKWAFGNKIAAVIFLTIHTVFYCYLLGAFG